jgi:ADP-ribosylglycohydrolase
MERIKRYRGCLLGLAVGDALGTTLEFKPPGSFTPITDMNGGGPFDLKPGQWTDDTSMALCLAESLIECNDFNPNDQMERYVNWWKKGHLSSTGTCFDIGNTTRMALSTFLKTRQPFSGPIDVQSAGNGSVMRLAPVPMFYAGNPRDAIEKSGKSSMTTHGTTACVDACRYLGGLIVGALNGVDKIELLSDHYSPIPSYWEKYPMISEIDEIAAGSFKKKNPPEIRGTGYVVQSLEATLWAFYKSKNFEEGALMAVNLGEDADTTGAIYGQIGGAYYGENSIPEQWRAITAMKNTIINLAENIFQRAIFKYKWPITRT